jgi:small-conductance mechanosensitive channel
VTIPNTRLTDDVIERPFEGGTGRFAEEIRIAYDADLDRSIELLDAIAADAARRPRTPDRCRRTR